MRLFKGFLVLILIFLLFISINAQKRRVHFFPLVPVNGDEEFCQEYSNLLKEKLIKSEVFRVTDVDNFEVNISGSEDDYKTIKKALKEKCLKENIESAIFGYVRMMGQGYHIYAELYYIENDDVISRFRDTFFIRDEIKYSTKNCALNFVSRINNIDFAKKTVNLAAGRLPKKRECDCADALGPALVTDMSTVTAAQKKKLDLLIGKYV